MGNSQPPNSCSLHCSRLVFCPPVHHHPLAHFLVRNIILWNLYLFFQNGKASCKDEKHHSLFPLGNLCS